MSIRIGRTLRKAFALRPYLAALLAALLLTMHGAPVSAQTSYPLDFEQGWNLAGNSLATPIDVATVLGAQPGITSVWKWKATNSKWAVYIPSLGPSALSAYAASRGFEVLSTINPGEGYWVNASTQTSAGMQSGTGFSLGTGDILPGWNLAATGDSVTADALATNLGSIVSMWSWDNANMRWYFHAPSLFSNSTLVAYNATNGYSNFGAQTLADGRGFWVNRVGAFSATVTPGNGLVTVSWPTVAGAGSYNIQRSVNGGGYTTLATNVTSPYVDNAVTNDTTYGYIVAARDAGNTSDLALAPAQSATPGTMAVYAALGGQNGLAINLGGHTYALRSASVYRFSPAGKRELDVQNYVVDFLSSAGDLLDATQFQGQYLIEGALTVAKSLGNQVCGAGATEALFTLSLAGGTNGWQGTYTASSCSIRVDYMSSLGGMMGEVLSATLSNGTNTITISNAPFRVYQHSGTPGAPPALPGDAYSSLHITTGTFELPVGNHFVLNQDRGNAVGSSFSYSGATNDGTEPFTLNSKPTNLVWIVQNNFFTTASNYNCGTVYTGFGFASQLNMRVWLGTYLAEHAYNTGGGGNCVITIDQIAGGLYRGHFTGTLVATDTLLATAAEKTIAVSGDFRNFQVHPYAAGSGGNEGSLPNDGTTNALTLSISDGSTHWAAGEQFLFNYQSNSSLNATSFRLDFNHPSSTDLQMRFFEIPSAIGTYNCGTLYGTSRTNMYLATTRGVSYGYIYNSGINSFGTGCTVQITRYDTVIEGNYTATLSVGNNSGLASAVMPGNDATITVSGSFRGLPPSPPS